jgi:hypothetical protein
LATSELEPEDWQRVEDGLRLTLLDDLEQRGCEPLDGSEGLTFYWLGWSKLSGKRSRGMAGPCPVKFSEVECWLDAQAARGELRELTHMVIDQLDAQYLEWAVKKNAK